MQNLFFSGFFCAVSFLGYSDPCFGLELQKGQVIFSEDFNGKLDTEIWKVEMDDLPGSSVKVSNGKLILNTAGGVTVWLNKVLSGNFEIAYTRKVILAKGKNDRVSDLNQFWMATDPKNAQLFTRSGKFNEYDNLSMYYVGIGGNTNTTTRFRKYTGDGSRTLLQEYLDAPHLLQANRDYHIKISVLDKETQFYLNGRRFFSFQDAQMLQAGYFGFRSTHSHQMIDDFTVRRLD